MYKQPINTMGMSYWHVCWLVRCWLELIIQHCHGIQTLLGHCGAAALQHWQDFFFVGPGGRGVGKYCIYIYTINVHRVSTLTILHGNSIGGGGKVNQWACSRTHKAMSIFFSITDKFLEKFMIEHVLWSLFEWEQVLLSTIDWSNTANQFQSPPKPVDGLLYHSIQLSMSQQSSCSN